MEINAFSSSSEGNRPKSLYSHLPLEGNFLLLKFNKEPICTFICLEYIFRAFLLDGKGNQGPCSKPECHLFQSLQKFDLPISCRMEKGSPGDIF